MDSVNITNLLGGYIVSETGKNLVLAVQNLPQSLRQGTILSLTEFPNLENLFSGNIVKFNFQASSGEKFVLDVKVSSPQKIEKIVQNWQDLTFKVKSGGELQLQLPREIYTTRVRLSEKNTVNGSQDIKSDDKITNIDLKPVQIEAKSIKVLEVINKIMADMEFPQSVKNNIIELFSNTEVVSILQKIGTEQNDFNRILEPIRNTLLQMKNVVNKPIEMLQMQQKLVQDVKDLLGQSFVGKIDYTTTTNQKTVFSSPLGKIDVDLPIKLPDGENVVFEVVKVNIEQQKELLPLIKVFSDKLAEIWPKEAEIAYKPELLEKVLSVKDKVFSNILKIFKPLAESFQNPEILMAVLQKVPGFYKKDILVDLYKFYRAVIKDSTIEWLGKNLNTDLLITKQGGETLKQIEQVLSNSLRETASWREVQVPFFDGTQIQTWRIYVKKDGEEEKNKKEQKSGKRFIIDTVFSALGEFQFDGFASIKERKFDLIIRTSKQHNNDFCMQVMSLFKKSLYDVEYTGTIKINQKEIFVRPLKTESLPQNGVYI